MRIQNNFIKIKLIDLKKNKHSDKKKISLIKIIHLIDLIVKFKSNFKKAILLLFEQVNLSVKVLQESVMTDKKRIALQFSQESKYKHNNLHKKKRNNLNIILTNL